MRFLLLLSAVGIAGSGLAQTVCIDPGHPSEVGRGTQGKRLTEIHAAWIEANLLKVRLEKRGFKVILTKTSEMQLVRNRRRAEIANAAKADLMVRLHCDAAKGSGFTNYYPSQPGVSGGKTGPSKQVMALSRLAATRFHAAMATVLKGKLANNGLKGDRSTAVGAKQGALTGSIFSKVPVVLCEMVVLTNPADEAFLSSAKGRNLMAEALEAGVLKSLNKR